MCLGACIIKGGCLMNASATTCDHERVSECVWELPGHGLSVLQCITSIHIAVTVTQALHAQQSWHWQLYVSALKKAGRLSFNNVGFFGFWSSHQVWLQFVDLADTETKEKKRHVDAYWHGNHDGSLLRRQPKAMAHSPANYPQAYQRQRKA